MNRRGFLQAILAAGVAPAVIGSGVLMPVRKLIMPDLVLWGTSTVELIQPFQREYNLELALSLDEFSRRVLRPCVAELARRIDRDAWAVAQA